jgi:hypothetical protein
MVQNTPGIVGNKADACASGNVVYSASGAALATANREGRDEILPHDLQL